jgi:replicative DNA helicase
VDESPANFKELVQHAKHKFEQGISFVVSTGYSGIDQKINEGGYVPKRLTVLEAKTGLGKTSFISQTLCETAIRHRQGVLLLSFEMDTESIMYRMLSQATQIPAKDVIKMLESATGPTSQVAEIIEQLDKFISIKYPDNTGDVNYIESQILSYIRTYDCVPAIVVIDYIQQLTMGKSGRFTSQSDELTTISRTIRGFAQQYNTHIIVTSQVMETSDGISRSFGASGIEFAADHVLVLSKSQTDINKRILKFKKNRFGPSGDEIELFWNSKITSFFEIDSYNVNLEVDQKNLMTSSTYGKKGEFFGNVNQQERIPF